MLPLKDNIPTDRFPFVTVAIIVANILMYVFFQHAGLHGPGTANTVEYAAIPYEFTHYGKQCSTVVRLSDGERGRTRGQPLCEGQSVSGLRVVQAYDPDQPRRPETFPTWLTALTAMFMHGGIAHIAGNMLFLWIFGNNVEDSMGRIRYVLFYLLGGLAALGLQVGLDPGSDVPTLGASGAIAAVLGGYILLYPRARVVTVIFIILFFTILEIPALIVLGLWFLEQALFGLYNLTDPTGGGGVAYYAHIGGFVFGLLAIRAFATRIKQIPPRFPVY